MSNEKEIGEADCPIAGCGHKVRVGFTKNNLAVMRRPGCCQMFARSENADQRFRALVDRQAPPADVPPIAPPDQGGDLPASAEAAPVFVKKSRTPKKSQTRRRPAVAPVEAPAAKGNPWNIYDD